MYCYYTYINYVLFFSQEAYKHYSPDAGQAMYRESACWVVDLHTVVSASIDRVHGT